VSAGAPHTRKKKKGAQFGKGTIGGHVSETRALTQVKKPKKGGRGGQCERKGKRSLQKAYKGGHEKGGLSAAKKKKHNRAGGGRQKTAAMKKNTGRGGDWERSLPIKQTGIEKEARRK